MASGTLDRKNISPIHVLSNCRIKNLLVIIEEIPPTAAALDTRANGEIKTKMGIGEK